MNVYCIVNQTGRLEDATKKMRLDEPLAYSNKRAHSFRFTVLGAADLTGVGVVGQFVRMGANPVDTVSPINGTVSGNVCEVILPASCYVVPGRFKFTMDIACSTPTEGVAAFSTAVAYAKGDRVVYSGSVWVFTSAHSAGAWTGSDAERETENRTVLWIEGIVERNMSGNIIDPGTPVGNIAEAINNANAAASAANTAAGLASGAAEEAEAAADEAIGNFAPAFAEATANAAGSYVTYTDGKMYYLPSGHTANTTWANTTKNLVTTGGELTYLKGAVSSKADKTDTVLETTLSRGRQANITVGAGSFAFGNNVRATGAYSHAEGQETIATGIAGHAEGYQTSITNGNAVHVEGYKSQGNGHYAHAEGNETQASGSAHSEGYKTIASGSYSHAEGQQTTANKQAAHAEGKTTSASGKNAHAEGDSTTASGDDSHAEGYSSTASGFASHSEGNSTASGIGSHAEGSYTTASGDASHSEGDNTVASEGNTHAEGYGTTASGYASHSEGLVTVANHAYQHVFGSWNVPDPSTANADAKGNYVEIVGNGTNTNSKSNARTLDWSGNEALAGSLTLGKGTADEVTITAAQLAQLLALLN